MESQCDYFMYFPAVPFVARELLSGEPGRYRALPRRNHLYLGETVRFLLVLRCRPGGGGGGTGPGRPPWAELAASLAALASVSPGGTETGGDRDGDGDADGTGDTTGSGASSEPTVFRDCRALLTHSQGPPGRPAAGIPVEDPIVSTDEVIFPLTISLDKLPPGTVKAKEEISLWDVQILPNFNASYLPVMPDGSVLLVDDVCHHSGEVPVGAFCRVAGAGSACPCALSALEEHNFLFQLQAPERPPEDAKEGLEVPLVAVIQWSTPKLPFTSSIYTHYRLPSIRLERPRFVMTAACESPVRARQRFTVTYTLLNDLQDFLAVRLVWTPETATAGKKLSGEERRATQAALDAIVCHTPLNNLGYSRKGSALTIRVAFQALRAGLFELSQHMKLKLQFTASVANPPPEARPVSRKSSPSSPAVRDLVERHQAGLGRSQSFSHQQPSRSHLMRSGSVMERRAITPPVGSPVGRPLYLPPEKTVLSLDKIAKRECKVLVVEPVK
ncbi:trafficking protein particle complex subunit 14 isoform 2-T2 [Pluvialis apricaria]